MTKSEKPLGGVDKDMEDPAVAKGVFQTNSRSFAAFRNELETRLRDLIELHGQSTGHYDKE